VNDAEARAQVERVEALLGEVESLADARARDTATATVGALLELYGEGLARLLAHADGAGAGGFAEALAGDELVSHLLVLHDLHPVPLEARVRAALEEVRPYLESHGGDVELLAVEEGVVRLRMQGSCDGCPSSAMTLKLAIEDAIRKAAPEVEEVEAEGAEEPAPPALIQLEVSESLRGEGDGDAPVADNGTWATAGALPELAGVGTVVKRVAGEPLLFLRLGDSPYAYRPVCPACGESLAGADLVGDELACRGCGARYDARRAGRSLDGSGAHLEPVPLLVTDAGMVKVAIRAAAAA